MTIYARLNDAKTVVLEVADRDLSAIAGSPKLAVYRVLVVDALPVLTATQKAVPGPYVIEAAQVRQTWTIAAKTQAEQDADQQATELALLKAMVTGLNTDIAAGITTAPTTAAQAFVDIQELKRMILRLNRVSRWLLKQQA